MNAYADAMTGPSLDNRRVAAALVDLLVLFAGGLVLGAIFGGYGAEVQALGLGWALYYYFALESGDGQTLGKRLMRIRVVSADGRPAGMRRVLIRTVLRVVDGVGLYLVGLVVMLVTGRKRQRLGDLAAGTVVMSAEPAVEERPEEDAAESMPAAPEAVFEEPAPLLDDPAPADPAPIVEEPVLEEPVVEEPVLEEPIVEEPVLEEPLPDEIASDPAGEEPHVVTDGMEIVSNPIELVMGDDETAADEPSEPA